MASSNTTILHAIVINIAKCLSVRVRDSTCTGVCIQGIIHNFLYGDTWGRGDWHVGKGTSQRTPTLLNETLDVCIVFITYIQCSVDMQCLRHVHACISIAQLSSI